MGVLSLHQTPQPSSLFILWFILLPSLQAAIQLHLLSVIVDVTEAGSATVVVDDRQKASTKIREESVG